MLSIQAIRNHVANDRPTELHLAVLMDGTKTDETHTGDFTDTQGNAYTNKVGDVLRIAASYDEFASMMGKRASFAHIAP